MNRKNIPAALASFFIAALPTTALALSHSSGPEGEFAKTPGLKLLVEAADLTADQKSQVDEILSANTVQNAALKNKIHTLREQIAVKLTSASATINADEITALLSQINGLRDQVDQLSLQAALKIRALLKPEQLAKVALAQSTMKTHLGGSTPAVQ